MKKEILVEIGQRLRDLRESHGLKISELAALAEEQGDSISAPYISKVERGESNTTLGFLIRVGRAMDVSPRELFIRVLAPSALDDLRTEVEEVFHELLGPPEEFNRSGPPRQTASHSRMEEIRKLLEETDGKPLEETDGKPDSD